MQRTIAKKSQIGQYWGSKNRFDIGQEPYHIPAKNGSSRDSTLQSALVSDYPTGLPAATVARPAQPTVLAALARALWLHSVTQGKTSHLGARRFRRRGARSTTFD